ncbi:hypothetical protein V1283_005446 [Bradyrhizobium sp. AZCC 2262]
MPDLILRSGVFAASRRMKAAHPAAVAPKQKVSQSFQPDLPGPVLREKRIAFARDPNQSYNSRHPGPQEGRIAIVMDVGSGMRWTRKRRRVMRIAGRVSRERSPACQTNGAVAYGKTVWSRHPWLVSSRRRFAKLKRAMRAANSPAMEARRIRLQGERGISRQTIAQGRPDAPADTCMLVCVFFALVAHETAGASQHPAFPAPSDF